MASVPLPKKIALVTGGSRGIGAEICRELSSNGYAVIINHFPSPDMEKEAKTLAADLSNLGQPAFCFGADVTNPDQVAAMMEFAQEECGGLDLLVTNAGLLKDRTLAKMNDDEWHSLIDVNLTGAYNCCKHALTVLNDHSVIIGIGSITGVYGNFGQSNYAASKAGLIGFYKSLAKELGPKKGIRVNVVAPGLVDAPMAAQIPEESRQIIKDKTPLRRLGTPADIAKAVAFLASDNASFITGHVLHVDGGLTF
ncbi:hypothetical protein AUK40_01590 [Candidatus Wirthbacteria bacterium CG2_30_54_11]|uniref:Ketoreductase domain-containing protein n=1 Tax=Candidatus Wirthbacteria bacterium CG2_30_54_11 TaxID=1817892 RepID=A0A1J5IMV7_9BACT|nr:MAG: hypothetical protein AUK40_01590 [Candidatus Wirthbacteria bacterium CG2_30_54_11]